MRIPSCNAGGAGTISHHGVYILHELARLGDMTVEAIKVDGTVGYRFRHKE